MGKETVTDFKTVEEEKTVYYCDDCGGTVESRDELTPVIGNPELRLDRVNAAIKSEIRSIYQKMGSPIQPTYTSSHRFERKANQKTEAIYDRIARKVSVNADYVAEFCDGCYDTHRHEATTAGEERETVGTVPINTGDDEEDTERVVGQVYEKMGWQLVATALITGVIAVIAGVTGAPADFAFGMVLAVGIMTAMWLFSDPRD